jgi:hypothetical protein
LPLTVACIEAGSKYAALRSVACVGAKASGSRGTV